MVHHSLLHVGLWSHTLVKVPVLIPVHHSFKTTTLLMLGWSMWGFLFNDMTRQENVSSLSINGKKSMFLPHWKSVIFVWKCRNNQLIIRNCQCTTFIISVIGQLHVGKLKTNNKLLYKSALINTTEKIPHAEVFCLQFHFSFLKDQ